MKRKKVNLSEKFQLFDEHWTPKILAEVNDSYVKIFKAKGEFIWHWHEHEDELFLVIKGQLKIKFRDDEVTLDEGELLVVPRGVEHLPYAEQECHVLLLELKQTAHTGDTVSEKTVEQQEWI